MKKSKKVLAVLLLVALAVCVVGTTLAWLTDTTNDVVNTFTVGNIDIKLEETKNDFKMVPGDDIDKDPKVTVESGSEYCWLFVKITKSANLDSFIEYTVDSAWTPLDGVDGVYYIDVDTASEIGVAQSVLTGDKVTVKGTVTKDMMDAITKGTASNPTLTFKAYAIQKEGFATAALAWAEASK